jgi:hypothetical protein
MFQHLPWPTQSADRSLPRASAAAVTSYRRGSAATANPDIPTFAAIAARADTTPERLAGRIIVPHPPMPNTQLTMAEIRDIIAYIVNLKPSR